MSQTQGKRGEIQKKPSSLPLDGRGVYLYLALFLLLGVGTSRAQQTPLCFFTNIADRLIRHSTAEWANQNPAGYTNTYAGISTGFSLTNIPVLINGQFVYSPAVNRLLQLSANIYQATTNSFYPSVFRPEFYRDPSGNVYICGYEQVASVTGPLDPQLFHPVFLNVLPPGISTNGNIYGVPWIIGAVKNLPNFNQFFLQNEVQLTRKVQISRADNTKGYNTSTSANYRTNQMFIMSINNTIGYSFWNSYATNYPGGAPCIYVQGYVNMILTNAFGPSSTSNYIYYPFFQTNIVSSANSVWPGSQWNLETDPNFRSAAQNSFYFTTSNIAFLPESIYQFETGSWVPETSGWDSNVTSNPILPPMGLMITNAFQAYILDGSNVIDYVQMIGPNSSQNLNADLMDTNPVNNAPYQMWLTNASVIAGGTGANQGLVNQIFVSQTDNGLADPNSWSTPPNIPPGLRGIPQQEANFFKAFFTGQPFVYIGNTYINTNFVQQAPYTPRRTLSNLTLWQANDPLVHYLASDLTENNAYTGIKRSDSYTNALPVVIQNAIGNFNNSIGDDRYQPWGRIAQFAQLNNVDHNSYNLAYRDPLVYSSDDWSFPANASPPLNWLGQVHRGTPWQTLYLKSTNVLALANSSVNGPKTWMAWTGDADPADAANSAPVNDWQLVSFLNSILSTNNLASLLSVNNPAPNAWLATLDGLTALTNSTPTPFFNTVPELDPLVISSNSSQAAYIVSAIQSVRVAQTNGMFIDVSAIMQTPQLAEQSPYLNISDANHLVYSISDTAYEAIPSQLLPLLRNDSIGSMIVTNGQFSVQFSGYDNHCYQIQVSSDLVNWTSLGTNQPVNGTYGFTAPLPASGGGQFYRSVLIQ